MAYEDMTHAELRTARDQPGADQQALAPAEHQAFAREYAVENPVAALGLVAGIPAYQAAKGVGLLGSRTGSSQPGAQMAAGYKGLGQGWGIVLRRFMESVLPSAEAAPAAPETVIGASPIDRRGPFFGAPPYQAPTTFAPAKSQGFESEYERELRIIRGGQNSAGGTSIFNR